MAEIKLKSATQVDIKIHLVLSEDEARALEAICGYGPDQFVKWFYKNLGKFYLQPHETAMRSLFDTVRSELPKQLRKADEVKKTLNNLNSNQ